MKPEVVIEVVNDLDIGCSKRQVSGGACGGIQKISCLLYGTSQKKSEKDAVVDCNSLQATEKHLCGFKERNYLGSKKC